MRTLTTKSKGFTIIEVVLVLAIAGLIFLVVFLALPALQRGQRDTQRKQDLGKFMSQLVAYQSNTQGALPTAWGSTSTFVTNYLGTNFNDPSTGTAYTITSPTASATAPAPTAGQVFVYVSASCAPANTSGVAPLGTTNNRVVAVVFYQEQGALTCQSNQ